MSLTVEEVTAQEVRMRLQGSVSLNREKNRFPYACEAKLSGRLVYNRGKDEFTRFDVLWVADWTWLYERKGGQKEVLGVALELAPRPFASPEYDRHFPGYNMSNYGYKQDRE